MTETPSQFQVFAKPGGAVCNLNCEYCYYLGKEELYPAARSFRMTDRTLEAYIVSHIAACRDSAIAFSWHGGEPTVLGLEYFEKIVALQQRHCPPGRHIANGIQTNGSLLDDDWCRFLSAAGFTVGLSMDGPAALHDRYRVDRGGRPTHERVLRGYELLQRHRIPTEILCVVSAANAGHPLDVYGFLKELGVQYITFLPLVEIQGAAEVTPHTVPPDVWGEFLCAVFDEWKTRDIGRVKVQIFEEATRTAFGQDHSLCIFRETCGDVPVVEHNGDVYSCDHFVEPEYCLGSILERPLADLLESPAQRGFGQAKRSSLPPFCRECAVLDMCNGGCPKNRFARTPDNEPGLNYLCEGYRRFFSHCRPFVTQVAALWRRQQGQAHGRPGSAPG